MGRAHVVLSAIAGALLSGVIACLVLRQQLHMDFAVYWAAHHVANPYDVAALREVLQASLHGPLAGGAWPYPYPPSFLLLTAWCAVLPLSVAYVGWTAVSGGVLVASARHMAAPLLIFSPWVLLPVMGGQTPVLMGGLIYLALNRLDRPWLAGVLLGVAACIKPQLLLLVGAGVLFWGAWRTAAAAFVTGLAICALSVAVYGLQAWEAWLAALPQMMAFTARISPHLDVPGWPLKALALAAGLWLTWRAARRHDPAELALAALGSSLLWTPHALWYNAAVLAPAGLAVALRSRGQMVAGLLAMAFRPTSLLIGVLLALSVLPVPPRREVGPEPTPEPSRP